MVWRIFRVCFVLAACFLAFPVVPAFVSKDFKCVARFADFEHTIVERVNV